MIFIEPTLALDTAWMGVDPGYSAVKAAVCDTSGCGQIQTLSFPSIVTRATDSRLASSAQGFSERKTEHEITVDGVAYVVDTCEKEPVSSGIMRTELDDFPRTAEYTCLVYAAMLASRFRKFEYLTIGLPLHTFDRHAGNLARKFEGKHDFGHGEFIVNRVACVAQPVGSYYALAKSAGALDNRTATTIVDIGWGTSDVYTSSASFKADKSRCGGVPSGAAIVVREIAKLLKQQHNGRFDNLDRIDRAVFENRPLRQNGADIHLDAFVRDALQVTIPICRSILGIVKTAEDLTVHITGGAAHYYAANLSETLGCEVQTIKNPRFANAIGFCQAAIDACTRRGS
jgi:plasmid segregation protein ParM